MVSTVEDSKVAAEATTAEQKPDWAVKAEKAGYTPKKTIGEKIFDSIAYIGIGDILVFIGSVGLAYVLKYSDRKIPGTKNTSWAEGWENVGESITKFFKLDTAVDEKTGQKKRVNASVEDALMTTALMMPGNLAVLPIRWMERRKTEIVKGYNEKYGKPGKEGAPSDIEIGQWNTKGEAMQSWGSLIKGRLVAWLAVFSSLTIFSKLRPKALPNFMNKTGILFENVAAKLNLADKPEPGADRSADAPRSKNNKRAYFSGEIASIDFFADIAAIVILYISSKFFARKRDERKTDHKQEIVEHTTGYVRKAVSQPTVEVVAEPEAKAEIMPKDKHRKVVNSREASYVAESEKQTRMAEESVRAVQGGV